MASDAPHDPLALLDRDLRDLERAPARPTWNPQSVDSMIDWLEKETGLVVRRVPRIHAIVRSIIEALQRRERIRLAILGPRGGGKTKLAASVELMAYRWYGYSWQNVGGSLEQAKLCYSYVKAAHAASSDLQKFSVQVQEHDTRSRKGDSIAVSAASQTSVRGPHPVGSSGAGGLTLDEAAIIPDDICDASKGQLMSASPSALIQLSTMGERQIGRFWDLLQDPQKRGYRLETFDAFDVAKRCPYDCKTTCPVKEHFADDYYSGSGDARQLVHKAYCGGRAHETDGWIDVDEIAQHFLELGRESFERELLGKAASAVGHVYDPILLQQAVLAPRWLSKNDEQHRRRFKLLDKAAAIDWGWSGQCAICYAMRLRDALVVYDWEFFTHERFQVIREHLMRRCFNERIETVLADAANPSDNEELHEMFSKHAHERRLEWSPRVLPVAFGKWKDYAVGELRRRLEQEKIKFLEGFGGIQVVEHERAMDYLRRLHRDGTGKIVKADDHGPDACAMICVGFATSFRAATQFIGGR